ncbi:ImmA/IrrE family metallo-endopeptidase [Rosettibacter firmus]|uniref:ImmA/IrrE family metallo-endopeptidase n=1 Tax=Rosettibacter firmus TaxID=3111522 RepID=UPI00336C123C
MKTEIKINNNILIWAIERAGSNINEISEKIPAFTNWLSGKKNPTLKQLKTFAQKLHLPFGYLFLENPPEEKLPIPFFRTIKTDQERVNLNVYETILIIQQRQKWLSDYLRDSEYDKLDFVGKFKNENNIEEIVRSIRTTLNLSENWANEFSNWEKAKEHFTQRIEDSGIIVNFSSIVGNNTHRKINVEECRGFVLVDEYVPFMFINSADSKSAQIFTLAHELAHIWIGQSAGFDFRQLQPADNPTEILCDKIAAEFLVPEKLLTSILKDEQNIENIARKFKVSQIVIARRLLDIGKLSRREFFEFYNDYINRDIQRKEKREDGGDFYKTQRKRLSVRFLSFVNQAVSENKLLIRDAYVLTSMKGSTYHKLMKEHLY